LEFDRNQQNAFFVPPITTTNQNAPFQNKDVFGGSQMQTMSPCFGQQNSSL